MQAAVNSTSEDAIIAEVERTESLICDQCVHIVTGLTEDARYRPLDVRRHGERCRVHIYDTTGWHGLYLQGRGFVFPNDLEPGDVDLVSS